MKKRIHRVIFSVIPLALVCLAIFLGGNSDSEVLKALPKYEKRVYSENGGIVGDKMRYAEYRFEKIYPDQIEEYEKFQKVDLAGLTALKAYVKDYEERIDEYMQSGNSKNTQFALNCCFYSEYLDEGDYYILETGDNDTAPEYYSIYYFDLSSKTLYYMYADIITEIDPEPSTSK